MSKELTDLFKGSEITESQNFSSIRQSSNTDYDLPDAPANSTNISSDFSGYTGSKVYYVKKKDGEPTWKEAIILEINTRDGLNNIVFDMNR